MKNLKSSNIAEVKISYSTKVKSSDRIKITSSATAAEVLRSTWDQDLIEYQEQFRVIFLNNSNKVLGVQNVSTGSMNACIVDAKVIFTAALKTGAASIIVAHNHPSGNLKPSEQDKQQTKKLIEGGKTLDIRVLDHIILSVDSYLSFGDEGLMN